MECRRGLWMRILSIVCLSVYERVNCDKTEKISPDFYAIRKNIKPSFLRKKMVCGATPSTWNFWSIGPRWSEIADFEPIIARSAWAVTPSEKSSINTNRKSPTCFPMSLRWSSYVVPNCPKGGSKTQNCHFSSKIALRLKKVCYKVSLCENCRQQSCKAFIGLTNRAKIMFGGHLLPEILGQTDRVGAKL